MKCCKVSVIMPVYNAAPFVEAAITSVLQQDWKNIELILINDGSQDESLNLIKKFESHPSVLILNQENAGQCAATNKGLERATGDYIQYLDADDILDKQSISSKIQEQLVKGDDTIVFGKWAGFSTDVSTAKFTNQAVYVSLAVKEWLELLFTSNSMLSNSCYLIPTKLVNLAGGYRDSLTINNDFEYFTRTISYCSSMHFCSESITYYRRGVEGSLSLQTTENDYRKVFAARKMAIDFLLVKYDEEEMRVAAANTMFDIVYYAYPKYPSFTEEVLDYIASLTSHAKPTVGGGRFRWLTRLFGIKNALRIKSFVD